MVEKRPEPLYVINSAAPIRICDLGGWTDTWFAEHGRIFNIGVYPYAEVQISVYPLTDPASRITIHAENYGERYILHPEEWVEGSRNWDKHPLLEAAIAYMGLPDGLAYEVSIYSEAPAGASTGTSAAVTVAMVGALGRLAPRRLSPHECAYAAHKIETDLLSQQSGIQDQLCSAFGGVNYIEMYQYPYATVSQIQVPNSTWWELERRLALVYLGKSHHSSPVHEMVIRELEGEGPDALRLEHLRLTAPLARDALYNADFPALGRAMERNTLAQRDLHPGLVSQIADKVIEIAQEHKALGWKVNGAGGEGGSLTLLCGESSEARRAMLREIEQELPGCRSIPIYLSRFGLRVWQQT